MLLQDPPNGSSAGCCCLSDGTTVFHRFLILPRPCAGAPLAAGMFRPLSAPQEAWHFTMASPPEDAESKTLDVTFTAGGRLNAVVFWFELDLGHGFRLSTGPQAVAAGASPTNNRRFLRHPWRVCLSRDETAVTSGQSRLAKGYRGCGWVTGCGAVACGCSRGHIGYLQRFLTTSPGCTCRLHKELHRHDLSCNTFTLPARRRSRPALCCCCARCDCVRF